MLAAWFLIGSCLLNSIATASEGEILPVKLSREVISGVVETWALLLGGDNALQTTDRDNKILRRMTQLGQQIATSDRKISSSMHVSIETLRGRLAIDGNIEANLNKLIEVMHKIGQRESEMQHYLALHEKLEGKTLLNFAQQCLMMSENNVPQLVSEMERLVLGSSELQYSRVLGVLEQLGRAFEAKSKICTLGLSVQQMLYNLYLTISIAELKGYAVMQFAWMLLHLYGAGDFTSEASIEHSRFKQRINRSYGQLQRILDQASREYWRCDPEWHTEGETFLQMTRLVQGYVVNEVDLNDQGTCQGNCGQYYYGFTQQRCVNHQICPMQTRCSGRIYDCRFEDSDMWICPAATSSHRRYEYIQYVDGTILGQRDYCRRGKTRVDSWWRWLFWHCSFCFCMCDDAGASSDRYINLRESVSDVMNNKVVTGLRFVKKNRVIHLIVQQGTLLPQGQINSRTVEWVQPTAYSVLWQGYRNGQDYHTLTYSDRTMDLDDIVLPSSYVLTGVRFRVYRGHVNLQARMTKMDLETGQLVNPYHSDWTGTENYWSTELKLERPHVPTEATRKSVPDSSTGQYVKFGPSDRYKDAAQTTVPFFDGQPVVPGQKTPLGGCGIFHKGQYGFGGYVAPKVFTYNFGQHAHAPQIPAWPVPRPTPAPTPRRVSVDQGKKVNTLTGAALSESGSGRGKPEPSSDLELSSESGSGNGIGMSGSFLKEAGSGNGMSESLLEEPESGSGMSEPVFKKPTSFEPGSGMSESFFKEPDSGSGMSERFYKEESGSGNGYY